ncbi:extracellular solute-binding protein [Nonomuraea antimicrobica]|uniref:Extracellular solute-binding protein n=1 Tax=Nonomuraea antimicrobica TaxID=561173 RepID=A0ABP7BW38_9ACTN
MITLGIATMALSACSSGGSDAADSGGRQNLQFWFWGAPPAHQDAMKKILVDGFNAAQNKYTLTVTFNNNVDQNVQVALTAGKGPDIVYGSGPSFAAAYVAKGKLADMDAYAQKYGWKDKILAPMYEAGTVDGKLYSLPNSLNTLGIFYNKKVLDQLGAQVPTTFADLQATMDKAKAAGLYASVTGNKGWKPVNENYSSLFLTHAAGPEAVYKALKGEIPWTDPAIVKAVQDSADFFKNGYLAGEDYSNLNFTDAMQLLKDGKSPFFIGPSLAFQFATDYFNAESGNVDDLGFTAFPNVDAKLPSPLWTLGSTASLSINAASPNKDGAAEVINYMMSADFSKEMTAVWPGYWGAPLKTLDANPDDFTGLSKQYILAIQDMSDAVNKGDFGYFTATFFPPATQQEMVNIDSVWLGQTSAQSFLSKVESTFKTELDKKLVPPIPEPAAQG